MRNAAMNCMRSTVALETSDCAAVVNDNQQFLHLLLLFNVLPCRVGNFSDTSGTRVSLRGHPGVQASNRERGNADFTGRSPYLNMNSHFASQEMSRVLCAPRVHCNVHESSSMGPVLRQ
jgi:hypothetical protein